MKVEAPKQPLSVLDRARRYLGKCPPAVSGQQGHKATFRVACLLVHGFALPGDAALALLREWNQTCQPPWSEADLAHKINSALATTPKDAPGHLLAGDGNAATAAQRSLAAVLASLGKSPVRPMAKPRKVAFEPETLKRVAADVGQIDADFIKARSPRCPETQTPASFLQCLYRPGEKVLVFDVYKSQGRYVCECVEPPYDADCLNHMVNGNKDGVWFLCNPVDGEYHPNPRQGGTLSRRSEESVTAWRYLVLESDDADAAEWLAILVQLPLRIAAIYTSGGRSIHALIRVDAVSKADWDAKARKLKPLMTILGADPASITAVRLTRLPGCYRMQDGPSTPPRPFKRKRWVDEPLQFDAVGDPILTPTEPDSEPPNPWTNGHLQELLYLNPDPDTTPIQDRPTHQQIHEVWLAGVRNQNTEAQY